MAADESLSLASARGRWVLAATVIGSGMAILDATVVNIALPAIGRDLGGGLAGLQWIVTAYSLTLASFLLFGGALGDRFGRRRVFVTGVIGFTIASIGCGLALSAPMLIAARALQGVGGALLTPGSLAILQSSFREEDRAAAVGAWSGLGGVATAIGPFAGGYLIQAASWRLIFLLNVPLAVAVALIARRHVPESRDAEAPPRLDVAGAALAAAGLGGVTYALIELPSRAILTPAFALAAACGVGALVAFFALERRRDFAMLDLALFRSRQFAFANLETFIVYAALGGAFFLLPVELQIRLGYSPIAAGAALLPVTTVMLALSARMGKLSQVIGPRLPMSAGPMVCAAGLLLLAGIGRGGAYWVAVMPGIALFGLGLSITVAPLTATVLAAAPAGKAGIASAINNCVARSGGLIAIAVLPAAAGLAPANALSPERFDAGFHHGMIIAALLCVAGGVAAWSGIRSPPRLHAALGHHCPLDAPPLRPAMAPEGSKSPVRD